MAKTMINLGRVVFLTVLGGSSWNMYHNPKYTEQNYSASHSFLPTKPIKPMGGFMKASKKPIGANSSKSRQSQNPSSAEDSDGKQSRQGGESNQERNSSSTNAEGGRTGHGSSSASTEASDGRSNSDGKESFKFGGAQERSNSSSANGKSSGSRTDSGSSGSRTDSGSGGGSTADGKHSSNCCAGGSSQAKSKSANPFLNWITNPALNINVGAVEKTHREYQHVRELQVKLLEAKIKMLEQQYLFFLHKESLTWTNY